jgi:hypothetical protein
MADTDMDQVIRCLQEKYFRHFPDPITRPPRGYFSDKARRSLAQHDRGSDDRSSDG